MQTKKSAEEHPQQSQHCGGEIPFSNANTTTTTIHQNVKNYPDAQSQTPSDCGNNVAPSQGNSVVTSTSGGTKTEIFDPGPRVEVPEKLRKEYPWIGIAIRISITVAILLCCIGGYTVYCWVKTGHFLRWPQ